MTRREWLLWVLGATGATVTSASIGSCSLINRRKYPVSLKSPNYALGHRLRKPDFPPTSETSEIETLIVGGGIAGLSAGWQLLQNGQSDFEILELESETGGNSRSSQNNISAFPLGAHYLTLPEHENPHLMALLKDFGVVESYTAEGLPNYREEYLCAEPEERLLRNGKWQAGLIPQSGLSKEEKAQTDRFFAEMDSWKNTLGNDGRYAFSSPIALSSRDDTFWQWDRITFAHWLQERGFSAKPLLWYLNYCCRDEYGSTLGAVSAWAGLHYFASRRGKAGNASSGTVLTWPEGNGWLVNQFRNRLQNQIKKQQLVYKVMERAGGVSVEIWDDQRQISRQIQARKLILAVPAAIAARLFQPFAKYFTENKQGAPWLVSNISLKKLPDSVGEAISWDNVSERGKSLGYVVASHQTIRQYDGPTVVTIYHAITDKPALQARKWVLEQTAEQWADWVEKELETMHPNVSEDILGMEHWIWGHGMVCPVPNTINHAGNWYLRNLRGNVQYAHSDLSGISTIEEACCSGISAVERLESRS